MYLFEIERDKKKRIKCYSAARVHGNAHMYYTAHIHCRRIYTRAIDTDGHTYRLFRPEAESRFLESSMYVYIYIAAPIQVELFFCRKSATRVPGRLLLLLSFSSFFFSPIPSCSFFSFFSFLFYFLFFSSCIVCGGRTLATRFRKEEKYVSPQACKKGKIIIFARVN